MALTAEGNCEGRDELFEQDALKAAPVFREELEVKFSVDPSKLPTDLLEALETGQDHESTSRKGRITQLYLPVNKTTLALATSILEDIEVAKGKPITPSIAAYFRDSENVTELRILRREQDHIGPSEEYDAYASELEAALVCPDAFQITIKGKDSPDGERRAVLETDISDAPEVAGGVVRLLESLRDVDADGQPVKLTWRDKVKRLDKMWYDIKIPDPFKEGEFLTVELDFFPDLSYFAIAEVEFPDDSEVLTAQEKLEQFLAVHLPPWFHTDLTDNFDFRSRCLAEETTDTLSGPIAELVGDVRRHLKRLYQPTALGNQAFLDDKSRDKSFVVLGSFKRFLPQFARIGDDLARQSAKVFPRINTLDVARRRLSDQNDENDSFRIEVLEDLPLSEAEIGYLRRIKESDAVYVVCPEGRLGGTSTQEMVYALGNDKSLYFATRPERVSASVPWQVRGLVQVALLEIIQGTQDFGEGGFETQRSDFAFQNLDFGPHVQHYFYRATGGDYDSLRQLLGFNLRSCISEIWAYERACKRADEEAEESKQLDLF